MKTQFVTPQKSAQAIINIANSINCTGTIRPEHFIKIMKENTGSADEFSPLPPVGDGLERKNPLIVALGDSVTAGRFEPTIPLEEIMQRIEQGIFDINGLSEVTDLAASYTDKFRYKLTEKYDQTSVSVINSGIAGDTIIGMAKRLDRDVLRYQPDLILINASLNWFEKCGNSEDYRKPLEEVVYRAKNETHADVVLMTPNMGLPTPFDNPLSTLDERVEIVRETAAKFQVCLVDTYKIWDEYKKQGYPISDLLANGSVHPSETGHEVYAIALMKLFE